MSDASKPHRDDRIDQRPLPTLIEQNRFFWTSGSDGRLRFLHCRRCDYFIHPYGPVCPTCLSDDIAPEPVSGLGRVRSVTLNHQQFMPGMRLPHAIAIVELVEQRGLNLTTNIIGIPAHDVRIGMSVKVIFERHDDIYVPLFEPAA